MLSGSVVSNSVTPGTVVCQAPLSMGFPRQEYCSGWPFPPPGDLPGLGSEPGSLTLAGGVVNCCATGEAEEAHDITAIKIDPHTHKPRYIVVNRAQIQCSGSKQEEEHARLYIVTLLI